MGYREGTGKVYKRGVTREGYMGGVTRVTGEVYKGGVQGKGTGVVQGGVH